MKTENVETRRRQQISTKRHFAHNNNNNTSPRENRKNIFWETRFQKFEISKIANPSKMQLFVDDDDDDLCKISVR